MHVNESGLREVPSRTMDSSMAGAAAVLEGAEHQLAEQESDFFRALALTLNLKLHTHVHKQRFCVFSLIIVYFSTQQISKNYFLLMLCFVIL